MIRLLIVLSILALPALAVLLWVVHGLEREADSAAARTGTGVPMAVLGDSDSHSYGDRRSFPPASELRGGAHRATTLQWTEALDRLRGGEIDQGDWGLHGARRSVAVAAHLVGLGPLAPRKEDYRYNFAVSRLGCADLMGGNWRLAPALAALMRRQPARWRDGIVVIRIGVNSFGSESHLQRLSRDPHSPDTRDGIAACLLAIRESMALLREQVPTLRFVLVGVSDNAQWAPFLGQWRSSQEIGNIRAGLAPFDQGLRAIEAADPRVAYFDDQRWFRERWGWRDASGVPAFRAVTVGSLRVTNTLGDSPDNAGLADGHAGTALNALWAQSLLQLINERFAAGIAPIGDDEVAALAGGQAPPAPRAP